MNTQITWSEADLVRLIEGRTSESLTLDFKACDALSTSDSKKNELSKDVAAMANSAGGVLIYGVRELDHVATQLDEGYDPSVITKEWLEQVINSRIQRRIDGIRIHQIQLLTQRPGKVAYVVEVPQSSRAPHQSWDKKFYRRYNFESVPMEEYEVRDVANRSSAPDLEVNFQLRPNVQGTSADQGLGEWSSTDLYPAIFNNSPTPAEYASIHVFIDSRLHVTPPIGMLKATEIQVLLGTVPQTCNHYHLNWAVPHKMPIFEGTRLMLTEDGSLVVAPPQPGNYVVGWQVLAPRMSTRTQMYVMVAANNGCILQPGSA
jgi:hypothetical protein